MPNENAIKISGIANQRRSVRNAQAQGGISIDDVVRRRRSSRLAEEERRREEKDEESLLGKIGEFIAPTTKGLLTGEKDVTGRSLLGAGLEIGSFFVPAGAIARGLGLGVRAARGAAAASRATQQGGRVPLSTRIGEGSAAGGVSGGMFGAGQQVAREDASLGDIAVGTLGGAAIGTTFGAAAPVAFRGVSRATRGIRERGQRQTEETSLLRNREPDARVATKRIDERGRVVPDRTAQEAVSQGVPEDRVALIKNASDTDRSKMAKMLDIREKSLRNARFAAENRSTDVVGDTFLDQAKFIERQNRKAGEELGRVAERLAGKKVDVNPAVESFTEGLQRAGVRIGRGGKLNFKDSAFEGISSVQRDINTVWSRVRRVARTGDAKSSHQVKQFIDEIVEYGAGGTGLKGRASTLLKGVRRRADEVLDNTFPEYNRVNTEFAATRKILDDIGRLAGKRFRLTDDFADAQLGTLMRRIFSNTKSRTEILPQLARMQNTARSMGMKIDDDIINQAAFADTLEGLIGTEAPSSFQGGIERAVENVGEAAQIGESIARGGIVGGAVRAGQAGIRAARGVNQENMLKSLRALVGGADNPPPRSNFGRPKKPTGGAPKTQGAATASRAKQFIHLTPPGRLSAILQQGLKPSQGQKTKGVFGAETIERGAADVGGLGETAALRIKKSALNKYKIDDLGDEEFAIKNVVKPDDLEVSVDGKTWFSASDVKKVGVDTFLRLTNRKQKTTAFGGTNTGRK